MADWIPISKDIDRTNNQTMGATFAMNVPGGMLIRSIMDGGSQAMVFVPIDQLMVAPGKSNVDVWIEENKIT